MNRFRDLFEKWHPYWNWECFKSGMWAKRKNDMNKIQECAAVLSDETKCRLAMIGAVMLIRSVQSNIFQKQWENARGLGKRLAVLRVAQQKKKHA